MWALGFKWYATCHTYEDIVLEHPYNDLVTDKNYATGLFTGLVTGLYHGIENVDAAAANILSAPIPGFKGVRTDHERPTAAVAAA